MAKQSTIGMPVLLLRAKRPQEPLPELFASVGAAVTHIPLMRICFLERPEQQRILQHLNEVDYFHKVIVVSANAAAGFAGYASQVKGIHSDTRFFAIGEATQAALRQLGFKARVPGQEKTSEGLLQLPELDEVDGQQILILAGEGGRQTLEAGLRAKGAHVSRCALYRRQVDQTRSQQLIEYFYNHNQATVLVHSAELLEALLGQLGSDSSEILRHCTLIVPSERIAQLAQQQIISRVLVANSALPPDMVSVFQECYS